MRGKPILFPYQASVFGMAFGVVVIAMGIALAHAEAPSEQAASTQSKVVCRAKPGGWCDLRDWTGFSQAFSQSKAQ